MSILSVVNEFAMVVGVKEQATLFGSSVDMRTQAEIRALANEMAQRISYDFREWTQLKAFATFTGDGIKDRFPLPANYQRMLLTAQVWPSWIPRQPLRFIADSDEWLMRRQAQIATPYNEWTLLGNDMLIYPILTTGQSVSFTYLDKDCVKLNSGGYGDAFTNDLDSFRLPERLLKLGMIWQWKANKGSPYAEDMGTFSDALMVLAGSNKPAPIIQDTAPLGITDARVALPWPSSWGVPVP